MRLLLDTQILIWAVGAPDRLPQKARDLLSNSENTLFFSAVNIWEIAIKRALNLPNFRTDPTLVRTTLLDHQYGEFALTSDHAFVVATLPMIHRDPFDRILIAQAMVEQLVLVTTDDHIARYEGPIQHV